MSGDGWPPGPALPHRTILPVEAHWWAFPATASHHIGRIRRTASGERGIFFSKAAMTPHQGRYAAYFRVSTGRQGASGLGLEPLPNWRRAL